VVRLEQKTCFFQGACNCDAGGPANIDEGRLTNKKQLPVTQLNYGGSEARFSWILYKLDYLKCWGKAEGVIYPSENYQSKVETIENDIFSLESRATALEGEIITNDYYFKHKATT